MAWAKREKVFEKKYVLLPGTGRKINEIHRLLMRFRLAEMWPWELPWDSVWASGTPATPFVFPYSSPVEIMPTPTAAPQSQDLKNDAWIPLWYLFHYFLVAPLIHHTNLFNKHLSNTFCQPGPKQSPKCAEMRNIPYQVISHPPRGHRLVEVSHRESAWRVGRLEL